MLPRTSFNNAKLIFVVLSMLAVTSFVMSQEIEFFNRQIRGKFCGKQLSQVMQMMCKLPKKKDMRDEYDLEMPMDQPYFSPSDRNVGLYRPMNLDVIDPVVYSGSPFLTRLQAAAIVPNTRRHRRGIIQECCINSCSMDELRSYCRADGGYNGLN